ncbi:unnamed protein product [Meloidogyne enterolobii]|uniref:Uncharacterized protein n=2 Tax=Meloidogyne enterolobii TaxID=390850 RepID=A0ACB1A5T6_MELEN
MCERMVTYYFLSSPHFVLKRSFSTASLKVRGDYRERQGFNFVEKRDENSLPWTNSYRLWKWYRPEQDATEVENVYNDGMYRHNNKVIQREQKTQNWWSSTNGNEQYTTLKDGRYVSGPTREASRHLNFRNQSHSNNMTRIDDSLNVRRRGKLLDPQQEFGSVRAKLNHILFDEYIGGECSLSTILDWADQMRSSKVEETPLLNLIGRLQMVGQHSLIPPLYNAFIKSSEAKPYANRPEILLPAIANAFQV